MRIPIRQVTCLGLLLRALIAVAWLIWLVASWRFASAFALGWLIQLATHRAFTGCRA